MVNLYAIKVNRKNYASFRLMSYLVISLLLLRGLLPTFENRIELLI